MYNKNKCEILIKYFKVIPVWNNLTRNKLVCSTFKNDVSLYAKCFKNRVTYFGGGFLTLKIVLKSTCLKIIRF